MSATDRPTIVNVVCEHKIANHMHGTHACYVLDRCRCADCSASNTHYERSRTLWLAGVKPPPLVDARLVRSHVERLTAGGMGLKRIAEVSGVPHGALWKLIYGKSGPKSRTKRVRRETARALMNTDLDLAPGARIPADEAWSIVDELVARGWTKAAIGRRVNSSEAKSLQLGHEYVMVKHLATLRQLLYEPVPARQHPRGSTYEPKASRPPRHVEFSTPGVPMPDDGRGFAGTGVLSCQACNRSLADHSLTERCAA
jgi:hypothetical protein